MTAKKEKWDAKKMFTPEQAYRISSTQSSKAIDSTDSVSVQMAKTSRRESQLFSILPVEKDIYQIIHKKSGKVLDVMLAGVNDGAQVHLWEYTGADNQLWLIEPCGDGLVKIKSKASGKCLDVVGMSTEEGALLQIWEDVDGENQKWDLKAVAVKAAAPKAAKPEKAATPKKKAAIGRKKKDEA